MDKVYHKPVLLNEAIDALNINPDGIYVDATFGGGGHSREIAKRLRNGKLVAFDQDSDAEANIFEDEHLLFVKHNFRYMKQFLRYYGIEKIDGLLADLGVSSHHFDTALRGFSFRYEGELDMRMNQKAGFSAKDLLNSYTADDLNRIFRFYGELDNPNKVTQAILKVRSNKPLDTIADLVECISQFAPRFRENKFMAKVFQAIRIEVNKEVEALKDMLVQLPELMKTGARLVIISYHSVEDRLVKNFIRNGNFEGTVEKDFYGNVLSPFKAIERKAIVPDQEEVEENNRARSARMRCAEKI